MEGNGMKVHIRKTKALRKIPSDYYSRNIKKENREGR